MNNINKWHDKKIAKADDYTIKPIIDDIKKLRLLVYYTSVGEIHAELTNISIQSLIQNGKYKGDILVFADDHFIENNRFNVETIKVETESYHPCNYRIFYGKRIDASKYDQIMYMDSDIEVIRDVYPMFQANKKLLYCEEPFGIRSNYPRDYVTASYGFSDSDYEKYKDRRVVNSGCYCIDARLFNSFIDRWTKIITQQPLIWGSDQSGLNLLICKDLIPGEPFKHNFIHLMRHEEDRASSIMIHYICETKNIMLEKYDKHIEFDYRNDIVSENG